MGDDTAGFVIWLPPTKLTSAGWYRAIGQGMTSRLAEAGVWSAERVTPLLSEKPTLVPIPVQLLGGCDGTIGTGTFYPGDSPLKHYELLYARGSGMTPAGFLYGPIEEPGLSRPLRSAWIYNTGQTKGTEYVPIPAPAFVGVERFRNIGSTVTTDQNTAPSSSPWSIEPFELTLEQVHGG